MLRSVLRSERGDTLLLLGHSYPLRQKRVADAIHYYKGAPHSPVFKPLVS